MKHDMNYLLEEVEIEIHAGGKHMATAFAREISVEVEFSYSPGYAAHITADPFYSEPGEGPEVTVHSVVPTLQAFMEVGAGDDENVGASLVLDAGKCIKYLLTDDQIAGIEDAIDEYMMEGEEL